ncbi:FAD-dependent oxidoreductase [Rhodococcus sp. NPDC055024]
MDADVAVIGTGSIGSMTAWRLAAAGVDTLCFDQFEIGDQRTAASGESRGVVRALHLRPEFGPIVDRSIDLWKHLEAESGRSLYVDSGSLLISKRSSARTQQLIDTVESGHLAMEILDHHEIGRRYPAHLVGPDDVGLFERAGGVVRSDLAVIAAAEVAQRHGARMVTGHAVDRIETRAEGVEIEAGGRVFTARKAVVTPGPWASALLPQLAPYVVAQRIMIAWWAVRDPSLFTPEVFPSFVRGSSDTTGEAVLGDDYFGFPMVDGGSIKFAKLNTCGTVTPTEPLSQLVEDQLVAADSARVRAYLTGLHDHPHRTHVAMEGFTPDGLPIIGPMFGDQNVIVATGFSGSGFGPAAGWGEVLANLVVSGDAPPIVSELSPKRFSAA